MTEIDAESARSKLIRILSDVELLLRNSRELAWSQSLATARDLIECRDIRGIDQLFGTYGGMGSFNDLVIHPLTGDGSALKGAEAANDQLDAARAKIYELVLALWRYHAS